MSNLQYLLDKRAVLDAEIKSLSQQQESLSAQHKDKCRQSAEIAVAIAEQQKQTTS